MNMNSPCKCEPNEPYHSLVTMLEMYLSEKGRLGALDQSVKDALKENISELSDWGISSAGDFLRFASCLLKRWVPSENEGGTLVYQVCTVFYCEFPKIFQVTVPPDIPDYHLPRMKIPLTSAFSSSSDCTYMIVDQRDF